MRAVIVRPFRVEAPRGPRWPTARAGRATRTSHHDSDSNRADDRSIIVGDGDSGRIDANALLHAQAVELTLDVFNVLNLLNRDWGLVRETGTFASAGTENVPLLRLRGQDAAAGRNLYELAAPARRVVAVDASRWALMLGARYAF